MSVSCTRFIAKNCRMLCCLQAFFLSTFIMLAPRFCALACAQTPSNSLFPQLKPKSVPQANIVGPNSRLRTLDQHERFLFRKEPGLMLKNQPDTSDEQLLNESQRQAERRGAWIVPTLYALGGVITLGGLYVMLRDEDPTKPAVRARIFPGFSGGGAQANIHIRF